VCGRERGAATCSHSLGSSADTPCSPSSAAAITSAHADMLLLAEDRCLRGEARPCGCAHGHAIVVGQRAKRTLMLQRTSVACIVLREGGSQRGAKTPSAIVA
jgi:hypothetical protein